MSLGFYFDVNMCIGCHTCQAACIDKNNLEAGTNFRKVRSFETGVYPNAKRYHYSGACNHCTDAKCVKGCPTSAMHYAEDGTVQHDKDKCIGCKYCVWNCPYDAPQFIEAIGQVSKCNSCKDLRDAGQNPACVDACVMRCLDFGDLDKLVAKYGQKYVKDLPIMPSSSITKPSVIINPKECSLDPKYKQIML